MFGISLATLSQIVTDQAVALMATSMLSTMGGYVLGAFLNKRPDLKDDVQLLANYTEAGEALVRRAAVIAAEKLGVDFGTKGLDKLLFAADVVESTMAGAGIQGDPSQADFTTLIRALRDKAHELFPSPSASPDGATTSPKL